MKIKFLKNIFTADLLLYIAAIFALSVVAVYTWGKMQMGDSSVELTYGMLIKAGRIPYQDFYIHIMPLTSYAASFLLHATEPIHAANIVGVINTLCAIILVFALVNALRFSFWEKTASVLVLLGLYLTTLSSFNHHSFDVVLSAAVALFVVFLAQINSKRKIYIWAGIIALCSVMNFFVTQTYGFASMMLGFFVFGLDYIVNKNKLSLSKMAILGCFQLVFFSIFLISFQVFGRVSLHKMFQSSFATGYQQYTGTYGYGTIWRTSIANIESVYKKFTSRDLSEAPPSTAPISGSVSDTVVPTSLFDKIFVKKSGLLFSFFSLIALASIVYMAVHALWIFFKKIKRKEYVDPVFFVWVGMLGIFFASSVLVFQMNFSVFFIIFPLWLYNTRSAAAFVPVAVFRFAFVVVLVFFAGLLNISNVAVLRTEFQTRDYFLSKTKNENVWTPISYNKNFAREFRQVSIFMDQLHVSGDVVAYPRASEIYYLLGKIPPIGFPLVSFYRPGGAFEATVLGAEQSEVLIVFEPKFYGNDLGVEHAFALQQIQQTLDADFTLAFSSDYFKIYKHL